MKNILKFIGLVFLAITLAFSSIDKKTIVIDVSHGGHDSGINVGELSEKEITLSIAKKIKDLNKDSNIEVILTRDYDKFVALNVRTESINKLKPDVVISLHVNSSENKNKNGMEIFISNKNDQKGQSEKLAFDLLSSFRNRNAKIKNADLHLLNNVKYPIALVELGYLTNKRDRELLTSEKGQFELARLILKVIK